TKGELDGLQKGKLKIGTLLTLANYLLPPAVINFHKQYPGIELSIFGLKTIDIYSGLLDNELDIGIVSLPVSDNRFEFISLYTEELSLAVSTNHELSKEKSVSLDVLGKIPSILP